MCDIADVKYKIVLVKVPLTSKYLAASFRINNTAVRCFKSGLCVGLTLFIEFSCL